MLRPQAAGEKLVPEFKACALYTIEPTPFRADENCCLATLGIV
jgi:hypothetical protein